MKCPRCNSELRKIRVRVWLAKTPILTNQCEKCGYFNSEKKSLNKALKEIRLNKNNYRYNMHTGFIRNTVREKLLKNFN